MKRWLAPKRPGIPREYLPEPDWVVVRDRLAKAKLLDQEEKFKSFLGEATAYYKREQAKDEAVAWGGQVLAFSKKVRKAALALKTSNAERTIIRATTVSPFAYHDAQETLEKLVSDLDAVLKDIGEPTKSGAQAVMHARQIKLANRFWGAFITNGWPTKTSANSLLAQLLKIVLETAGEKRVTIKTLLQEARTEYSKSKTVR